LKREIASIVLELLCCGDCFFSLGDGEQLRNPEPEADVKINSIK